MCKFLFIPLFALCSNVIAHPLDLGVVQVKVEGSQLSFQLDLSDQTAKLCGIPNRGQDIFAETLGKSPVTLGSTPCVWQPGVTLTESSQTLQLFAKTVCPDARGELKVDFLFLKNPKLPSTFKLIAKVESDGAESLQTLENGTTLASFSVDKKTGFWNFVHLGISHIGATPEEWIEEGKLKIPDGIDHILFLLALILAGGGFVNLLKTATGFTVGHSITLALASLGVVQVSPRIIEPIIALSIAYVAIEDLLVEKPKGRWRIAGLFGLIHGFGFAGALTELNLKGRSLLGALVGFNVGVELGQILIMCVIVPVLFYLQKKPSTFKKFRIVASSLVALLGIFWFVQRAFF